MTDLILSGTNDEQRVSARELHKQLGIEKRFSAWFETNSQGFVEGEDYTSVLLGTEVQNNGGIQIRELQDYQLSLDMAKHICLMSRTEKGKECRSYLIQVEKDWNTPEKVMARALKIADKTIAKLTAENEELKPKALFADKVSASETSIHVRDLAKLIAQNGISIGQNRMFAWLRDNKYLMYNNMPYQEYIERGYFEVKENAIEMPDGRVKLTGTVKVTGRGQIYFINKFLKEKVM